jgi:hypothetical protein
MLSPEGDSDAGVDFPTSHEVGYYMACLRHSIDVKANTSRYSV